LKLPDPVAFNMKIITFGSAAILVAITTWAVATRPSLAQIEACCSTQAEQTKVEHYVRAERTGAAASALARHYANAAGGPADEARAMFWFRHAAAKGHPEGIARVGAYTANAAISPCFDEPAAEEALKLLGNEQLQSPNWKEHARHWMTLVQTAKASTPRCAPAPTPAVLPAPTTSPTLKTS
jgi:hypothetical protein